MEPTAGTPAGTDAGLQAAVDAAMDALLVLDGAGGLVTCNAAAEALFGISRASCAGRPAVEVVIPERLRERYAAGLAEALAGRRPDVVGHRAPLVVRRADGVEVPVELLLTRVGSAPQRWAAWLRDVSGIAEVQEAMRRTTALLSDADRLAAIGHWVWEPRTGTTTWSPACFEMAGLAPADGPPPLEGFLAVVHPSDRDRVSTLLAGAEAEHFPVRLLHADGSVRVIEMVRRAELGEDGEPLRFFGTMRDVTAVRQMDALWAAHRGVVDALTAWEGFAEGIGALLARLGTAMGWLAGGLYAPDAGGRTLACRGFWAQPGEELEAFEAVSRAQPAPATGGLVGRAFRERRVVVLPDVTADPGYARAAAAARAGLRLGIALPILHDDEVLAVLEFYAVEHRTLDAGTIAVLEALAEQLGLFLDRHRGDLRPGTLTPREIEVLQHAAEGKGVAEIAGDLVLSPATVRTHFKNIYDRLGVRDRAAAVAEAMRLGLVS